MLSFRRKVTSQWKEMSNPASLRQRGNARVFPGEKEREMNAFERLVKNRTFQKIRPPQFERGTYGLEVRI